MTTTRVICGLSSAALLLTVSATSLAGEVRHTGQGHAQNPVWSPDGKHVAFEINDMASSIQLYTSMVDGDVAKDAVEVKLPGTDNMFGGGKTVAANLVWHPSQPAAVFEGTNAAGQTRLYFYQPGGGAPQELIKTTTLGGNLSFPSFSPDGQTMAFVASETGSGDIRLFDQGSFQVRGQLTSTPSAEVLPTFSSTGQDVFFSRKSNGTEDLYKMNVETQSEKKIAGGTADQSRPNATKSSVLYFDNSRVSTEWDIKLVSLDGSGARVLAKNIRLPQRARPAVSPDGEWLVYGSADTTKSSSIYFVRLSDGKTVVHKSRFTACGEPAVTKVDGQWRLAYTALPQSGADWRFLVVDTVSL